MEVLTVLAINSIIFVKMVDVVLLLCSVEDWTAVDWGVVVSDVKKGTARVEFVSVVEGEDAREFKLIFPGHVKFRESKLTQAGSWSR